MIKADHKKWARILFNFYIDRELKKNFTNFYQVNEMPEVDEDRGLVFVPNHISWWDGFFIDYVGRKLTNRKLHIMMLEDQLKRYWFFQKLGAYSINPSNPKSVIETAEYSRKIISSSQNFAVIYPQGEIEPFEKRPLNLKQGLKVFLKNISRETGVIPIGFKIQYFNEKNPSLFLRFGHKLSADTLIENYSNFENEFLSNLDLLNQVSLNRNFIKDLF